MQKLHEKGRYGIVSFIVLFIIVWIFMFIIAHFGAPTENYTDFLIQAIIFSTLIALPVAVCCYFARGGSRDPKELTDGMTVVGI
jgi:predicted permease